MCIAIRRFPEHDLTLAELRGVLTGPELLDFLDRLQIAEGTRRWLNYVAPDADLSQLDLMSLTELKRAVGRKVADAGSGGAFRSVFVCVSRRSEPVIHLWANYLGRDAGHPVKPQVFATLGAAFDHLDLPAAAREAVSRRLRPPSASAARDSQEKPTTAWGT